MIKKLSLLSLLSIVFLTPFTAFWDWQDVINSLEKKVEQAKVKELNESFKLEKFDTKEKFETFLVDKLYDKILDSCSKKFYPRPYPILYGSVRWWETLLQNSISKDAPEDTIMHNTNSAVWWSEKVSYGKTNLQKQWVDEPEILKLSKDFIAYYDKQQWKIYIIKSPNDNWKLDINTVHILDTITVPSIIRKYNVQMFFVNNQLIVLGSRYSNNFQGDITDVVFYNIDDNWKAKFDRIYDIKWNFKHARIINWKVYIITDYSFSNIVNSICKRYIYDKTFVSKINTTKENIVKEYSKQKYDYNTINQKLKQDIDKLVEEHKNSLDKQKILNIIKDKFIQSSIDIKIDKTKKFNFNWKIYPIDIDLISPSLDNIIFLPTNFDKLNIYDLKFNLVNIIDLNKQVKSNQYVIFWNMSNGQIHMTQKSLYLVNNYYVDYNWRCPVGRYCILPYYYRWNFTLIHKLSLDWANLDYVNSVVISWQPINQYSMDEDLSWNFRIFTQSSYPTRKTELFTFDKSLNLLGMLDNIATWEQFKSSRFIEDKAYLVTFKATDPLFVIDLKDLKNPKIVWELKIPWYSLYLHPYKKVWSKQYLIWIWQQAEEVYWNRSLPKNIKIDLYEVDYASQSWDYIKVSQKYRKVFWNEEQVWNGWSYTPVFDNPRSFVSYKTENNTMDIVLPVYLAEDAKQENCYINYIWQDWKKIENSKRCNTNSIKQPYFIWIKWLNIDENKWITEIISKNYIDLYKKANVSTNKNSYYNNYTYKNEDHRASYYKLWEDIIPFEVNNNFLNIFKQDKDKTISFNEKFKVKNSVNNQCYYKKPSRWTTTCQMYCGGRWVLWDDWKSCEQIIVNAACSCPWFDIKSQCEKECVK